MKHLVTYTLATLSLFFIKDTYAQDEHQVISTGSREVEKAYRQSTAPKVIDTTISTPLVEYPLLNLQYETDAEVSMITPASIKIKEKLPQLYNSYLKLGVGSELMPLGEYYFDSKRSKKYIYGAHVKHLSSFGNLSGYAPAQFNRTGLNVYGGLNERRYSLRGDVHYRNQGLHYYGYPTDRPDTIPADSIAQRYSDLGFSGAFSSHKKDSATVNYTMGLAYNNFLSKKPEDANLSDWRARENFFGVRSNGWYKLGENILAADFNVLYNGYNYGFADSSLTALDTGIVSNNTIVDFHPTITTQLQNDRFKVRFGGTILFNAHDGVRAHIYPDFEVKYSMFNDIFIPYAGLRGGMQQVTFKHLTGINEFILPNVALQNENTSIDFYGGIKGTLSKRVSFNLAASFANVKNKAFFVNDTTYTLGNAFAVIYDTMNVTTLEGSIAYQLDEKLKVDAIARFNSYYLNNNSYAWNMPQLQVIIRGSYNLYDKFLFNLDLDVEQGRRALVYEMAEGVVEENGQLIQSLGIIADANLGIEYRYNSRISAFLQFNNFASQRYMRWYNAPVQQFQVMGGVTFRF